LSARPVSAGWVKQLMQNWRSASSANKSSNDSSRLALCYVPQGVIDGVMTERVGVLRWVLKRGQMQ
jgi:hypothetical protein